MSTKVMIKQYEFVGDDGQARPYERLLIEGTLGGEPLALEIKLDKVQLQVAKALLAKNEDIKIVSHRDDNVKLDVSKTEAKQKIF